MSNTALLEEGSSDPLVRELGRRAVRILNDRSIDRQQREVLIRQLQARLLDHQALVARKARQKATLAARRL